MSTADEISKLADLRNSGHITQGEFDLAKSGLLGNRHLPVEEKQVAVGTESPTKSSEKQPSKGRRAKYVGLLIAVALITAITTVAISLAGGPKHPGTSIASTTSPNGLIGLRHAEELSGWEAKARGLVTDPRLFCITVGLNKAPYAPSAVECINLANGNAVNTSPAIALKVARRLVSIPCPDPAIVKAEHNLVAQISSYQDFQPSTSTQAIAGTLNYQSMIFASLRRIGLMNHLGIKFEPVW